jgi:hypothetical protein
MFLAPAFLLGLLGIVLPIWLHRIVRENRIRQPFASSMLLEPSEVQRTAQRQLRYWLLLALRIALLVALALAFAQPLLPPRAAASLARSQLHAIVIDSSLSMQSGGRWQRALDTAGGLLNGLGAGDRALLVSAAGDRMRILGGPVPASEAGTLRAALATLRPGAARLDYGLLMRTAGSWLGTVEGPVQLHLITDLQSSGGPLRFADLQPPTATTLQLHEVDGGIAPAPGNAWLDRIGLAAQDSRQVSAHVAGRIDATRSAILLVDGRERERRPITSSGELLFAPQTLSAGAHRIEVRLQPADDLPQDDARYAVIRSGDVSVLLFAGDAKGDDAAYFSAAIGSVNRPRLRVLNASPQTLAPAAFDTPAALVIADTGLLTAPTATRLRQRLEAGGAVLATLGPRAAALGKDPLTGLAVRTVASGTPLRVSVVDDSHPILREAQDWRVARFFRHLRLQPAEGDKTLIALEDGSPLLLERRYGTGRLLLLAAPLDRDWNDLPIYPLFVRFITDAARYLSGDAQSPEALVGTPIAAGLTADAGGQIFDPQGRPVLALAATGANSGAATRLLPEQAGFYELRGNEQTRWLAVNVDPRESDLGRMTPATVARWQGLRPANAPVPAPGAEPVPVPSVSIGRWLLFVLAALALAELLFANRHLHVRREVAQ